MDKNEEIKPHFSFSYEHLITKSIEKEAFLRRDLADLTSRGMTVEKLDEMKVERTNFKNIPSNKTEKEVPAKSIDDRNKKARQLEIAIRIVINIAKGTFGAKSAIFRSFGITHLSTLSAYIMYNKSKNVVIKGNNNMAAMKPNGLKPLMLKNITSLATELLPLIAATPILATDAMLLTAKRQAEANKVFDRMMAYCEIGKSNYMDVDLIKYNNYIVYDAPAKVLNRKGEVPAKSQKSPKTNGINGNTKFSLRTTVGKSTFMYFGFKKGDAPPINALEVLANQDIFIIKTASQLGYNLKKGIIKLNIYNPNEGLAAFWVKIG